ncbi:MAG: hypothetical protein WCG01_03510 [bacterium]
MKFFIIILSVAGCVLMNSSKAQASEIFIDQTKKIWQVGIGQEVKYDVYLNTNGKNINAIDGEINFSDQNFLIKEISDGSSLVSLWLKKPEININKVKFSGLIPGGLKSDKAKILSLILTSNNEGVAKFNFTGSILLNDGLGTLDDLNVAERQITFTKNAVDLTEPRHLEDIFPPEDFDVFISTDQDVYDGQKFLIFSTTDKDSGLDYYEVKEGVADFFRASSPYLLKNQDINQNVIVRAVDKHGNKRTVTIESQVKPYQDTNKQAIIILVVLIVALSLIAVINFLRKK